MSTIPKLSEHLKQFSKSIENLKNQNIPIIPDGNNMIDKKCPNEDCKSPDFKIDINDWENNVKDETVFCPMCKNQSEAKNYLPEKQKQLLFQNLNNSIINSWKKGHTVNIKPILTETNEKFSIITICENCQTHFSVIQTPLVCPCCGEKIY